MPEGYLTTGDENYYLGSPSSSSLVEKQLKAARYINGVVLMMEYYEGNAQSIQKALQEREKLQPEKVEEINGFTVTRYATKFDKFYRKTQHFQFKDRVYVVKGVAKAENDMLLNAYFESVRLINGNDVVAPNAPQGAKATSLPKLFEQETPRLDDSMTVSSKELDREPIILKAQRPRFSFESRQGLGAIRVKLKVLYSSSGKVTDVEVLEITSKRVEREAVETAKNTVFIPAEKDGKLVSVYKIIEYSYGVETR